MKVTCRICKIQHGEFFTLDSVIPFYGQEHKLLDVYNKCLQMNAVLQDPLPQVICLLCLEKLKDFYEFQLKAKKSYLEFNKGSNRNKSEEQRSENLGVQKREIKETDASASSKEVEVITTEDEYEEEIYQEEEKLQEIQQQNNEENIQRDIEDTDILFELYDKNDSAYKYLKYHNEDSHNTVDDNDTRIQTVSSFNLNETKSKEIPSDNTSESIDTNLDSNIPKIEITRLQLPAECTSVQTLVLEPLVEIRKWQCCDCGRKYLTEENLIQHRKLHTQSENCECEICGSNLKSLYDYREHMKAHGTERKFSCEFCDKTFTTRANLKAHLYIHTNLRPFKCEICSKTFQQKSILKTHMTLHTGKPFECTLCNRRFSRTAHLNIHMRQHNNIRPYQCSQCPSSYMQKSHLDRHISSSHLGVRFQCTVCGKMYTKKPSLNTHMRDAHCTTVSLYNCDICDLDFSKQKGLYYHLKSKHPEYKKSQC